MLIRDETPADHDAVYALTEAAFKQPMEAKLVDALRASGDSVIALVTEDQNVVLAHVLLSKMTAPPGCLGLAPVSVAPGTQGMGLGAAIIREALARAKQGAWKAVFVLGEPAYYARFGFSVAAAAKFETPYPKEYFMALELSPGTLETLNGAVVYTAPFSALEE
jgi:putative acetyltransferase